MLVGRACFFLKRGETVAIFFCLSDVLLDDGLDEQSCSSDGSSVQIERGF